MAEDVGIRLGTLPDCRAELERVSNNFSALTAEFTSKRQRKAEIEQVLGLVRATTLIGVEGANKEEREAKVVAALAENEETKELVAEEAQLEAELEILKQRFKNLEARGRHAQSAIKAHEQEARFAYAGVPQ